MRKIILSLLAIIILVAGAISIGVYYKKSNVNKTQKVEEKIINSNLVELVAKNGETILDATKRSSNVRYTESSNGVLVNSINGKENDSNHFWIYSINGKEGSVATDKYFCKEGDLIKWEYKSF